MAENIHPLLKNLIPLAEGIAKTFGKNCEVSVHDISNPQRSIVAIFNGHITGKSVGDSMSDVLLKAISEGTLGKDRVNISSKSSDGKILKSSYIFIRDEKGKVIGALCINYDISEFVMFDSIIRDFCQTENKNDMHYPGEKSKDNVNDVLANIVDSTLKSFGKPVNFMTKDEKVYIVKLLDSKGVFLIKGAIDYVARILCVSRYTIYNYLDEVRATDEDF
ncbi:helix-turn-helix transcriptional regulator [Caldanaerobius polysaccharolyticus]|uniref:helix-turn-helix transcriptional regulator n=1 Tax=Caldanaerobius polysaccharolyticus TaxID=44256 RepID=UPI00047A8A08|nr:PAS domain-containing protein [Caldanaerobius polysaccharolyticus]